MREILLGVALIAMITAVGFHSLTQRAKMLALREHLSHITTGDHMVAIGYGALTSLNAATLPKETK
jgi:preprotein translocase subunit YajC